VKQYLSPWRVPISDLRFLPYPKKLALNSPHPLPIDMTPDEILGVAGQGLRMVLEEQEHSNDCYQSVKALKHVYHYTKMDLALQNPNPRLLSSLHLLSVYSTDNAQEAPPIPLKLYAILGTSPATLL
jgi:hypothetical protein